MKLKNLIILFIAVQLFSSCKIEVKEDQRIILENTLFDVQKEEITPSFQNIDFSTGNVTIKSITLNGITVSVKQKASPKENHNYSCHSIIIVSKNNTIIDSLVFKKIEALGGGYGLTNPVIINDHILLTKHGDYDGRTILINKEGEIFNFIGGENYIDEEAELLFTIFDSDLSGYAVFDLKSDSLLMSVNEIEDRTRSFHKDFGNRYFMNCYNDETNQNTIWEFEFDLERTMQVDLDSNDINNSNQLKEIKLQKLIADTLGSHLRGKRE